MEVVIIPSSSVTWSLRHSSFCVIVKGAMYIGSICVFSDFALGQRKLDVCLHKNLTHGSFRIWENVGKSWLVHGIVNIQKVLSHCLVMKDRRYSNYFDKFLKLVS